MPEYRRFIAYFYEYIDGKKQRNTGFAKVELRNGMWRILFRLNIGNVPEPPIQVYGFVREGGYLLGLPMGVMRPGREISEEWAYRAEMPVGRETYRLEDLSGLRIQSGDSRCFMTVWDDEEIDPDRFVLRLPEEIERTETDDAAKPPEAEAEAETSVRPDEMPELSADGAMAESEASTRPDEVQELSADGAMAESEMSGGSDEMPELSAVGAMAESEASTRPDEVQELSDDGAMAESEMSGGSDEMPEQPAAGIVAESEAVKTSENASETSAFRAADASWQGVKMEDQAANSMTADSEKGLPPSPRGPVIIHAQSANQKTACKDHRSARANCMRELLQRRERFEPFQDDEIVNCVQIMPCDIVKLQQEQWQVGRSSFLQHGYYQYRHLLLGTMRDGRYILGVPGMRNPQEKYMAEMFGFPHFKTSKICSCGRAFGYWYRELQD